MKKYKLIVVGGETQLTEEYDNVVKGFLAAEKRAEELLNKYLPNYPDTYIACFEKNEQAFDCDYPVFTQDYYGDRYWKMMVMGSHCPIGMRLLNDDERLDMKLLRDEVERHISDLNHDELMKLRMEINIGGIYLSDFQNSLGVDEVEVSDICDLYEGYLCTNDDGDLLPENEWIQDTPEVFADYCCTSGC